MLVALCVLLAPAVFTAVALLIVQRWWAWLLLAVALIPPVWIVSAFTSDASGDRNLYGPFALAIIEIIALWIGWYTHDPKSAGEALAIGEGAAAAYHIKSGRPVLGAITAAGAVSQWEHSANLPATHAPTTAPPAVAAPPSEQYTHALVQLSKLHSQGVLSKEEFSAAKARLAGSTASQPTSQTESRAPTPWTCSECGRSNEPDRKKCSNRACRNLRQADSRVDEDPVVEEVASEVPSRPLLPPERAEPPPPPALPPGTKTPLFAAPTRYWKGPGWNWSYDWCFARRLSHCWYPKQLDVEASKIEGYPVLVPFDRGVCPFQKWDEQEHLCPYSKPGEHVPGGLLDVTVPWSEGGQRGGVPRSGTTER